MAEDNNGWSAFYYSHNKDKKEMKIWFDRDAVLGYGYFSTVCKGKFGGREVAVKRVEVHRVKEREEDAMMKLDHPNIVKLLHCESDKDFTYYAFEWCDASLDQLFLKSDDPKKYKGPMPHHVDALLQLASGLEHIHSHNLVHGDIKPENVLISVGSAGQDEIILKWANFGQARSVHERGTGSINQTGGNNAWLAPELMSLKLNCNVEENNCKANAKSDVFAQGLVFGCLFLNGEHLYGSMEKENEIPQNIIEGNPINMQKIDDKLRDCYENNLLKKMLEDDTGKRMTSTQVVNQLKAIKNKIAGKEKELLELCGRDSRSDLTEKIKNLIQFGINLNAKDDGGRNALHLLCRRYSSPKLSDAIKLLIENKIDVNAKDNDGLNAIHYLCRYHSSQNLIEAIQILIQSGIDAKATTNDGSNALHYLCRYNSNPNVLDAIGILTELGLDLMTNDNSGWNALYYLQNKDKKEMKIWFDRNALLGQGGYGQVLKGKFGGREVAVKRVELRNVDKREEDAMMKLDHRNIVKLLHCESDKDFRNYALELCDASLDKLFLDQSDPKKYKGPLPRHIEIFYQLADGLKYIHSENLIHRDIKPENVLISVRSTGQGNVVTMKWADFGLSKPVNERGTCQLSGIRGTKIWFAPETVRLLRQPEKEEDTYRGTVKSDIFAQALVFGCLLLNGKHLYGCGEKEIHDNLIGKNPVNMQNIDAKLRLYYENDLLRKMLEDDPQKRITSKQVVEQLNSINKMFTEKEEELRQLCQHDSSSRLIEKINDLIQLGIDVNAKDGGGMNALHYLCGFNSNSNLMDAIRLLIQLGIDVNAKDGGGMNALHYLCRTKSNSNLMDAIQLLIQLGIDVNAKDKYGRNALHYLCLNDSNSNLIDAIRLLIQLGIDLNAKVNDGRNALHYLCENESNSNLIDAIRLLIQLGIDVNAKDDDGRNALHHLCRFNSKTNLIDLIQLFIDKGIDVNAKDNDGWNALHYLCLNDSNSNLIDAIRLLIQEGIDVNAKDKLYGQHALHYLCRNISNSNLIDAIRLLIQLGIDVNAKDKDGQNALHYLCRNNSNSNLIDAIQLFIDKGIDVNAKDNDGWNALHYLCLNDSNSNLIDAIRLLIQGGMDVNAKDNDGRNALHHLCWNNSNSNLIDAIRLLIQEGIDVNAKDKDGQNALHYLCRNNSNSNLIDAIRLLIQLGIDVVSNDHDARSILRRNYEIENKEEILTLLDEAALV